MVITDLDGTLLSGDNRFPDRVVASLKALGAEGIPRCIATGRTLYSARRVIPPDFPIDYLIFSSGAGIADFKTGEVLVSHHLAENEIVKTYEFLVQAQYDFMVHGPIPENHHFVHFGSGFNNPDFRRRCAVHAEFCQPGVKETLLQKATQFLVVVPPLQVEEVFDNLSRSLSYHSVIRATSPLDKVSGWLEIFSREVSKGRAARWLTERLGIKADAVLAVGNDYNDVDLLAWSGTAFLVSNAVPELRGARVASNDEGGFSDAVDRWREQYGK